ncbi:F-box/LRR-repeat protein At5g63520 [Impatiens glandulifera]|uniref:F-box/LRR-repeat protein At5g63520 n=1 Tax=Impatiens glandulifera TaxID=253017 RepID=UPI001FB1436F|nr:F-box/LRR-repeat protein At5g63520 [Impatiens glandulifera]
MDEPESSSEIISDTKRGKAIVDVSNGIEHIGEDLLHNVLSRLPATSFASAACINRSWNRICNRILSRPKMVSAISTTGSLTVDVTRVLEKVLQEPIRPHFAIVSVSPLYSLTTVHQLITQKFGPNTAVVTSESTGIMGTDCSLNTFTEIQWRVFNMWDNMDEAVPSVSDQLKYGIMLAVGYVPGLKVSAIALKKTKAPLIDNFVMDIKNYVASVSNNEPPAGIIMFGAPGAGMKLVLSTLDNAMPLETPIIGDESCRFMHSVKSTTGSYRKDYVGVALVFARDKDRPRGIGEIEFHVSLSTGLSAVGPMYTAVSVKERCKVCSTWLTARREGDAELLDGCRMICDTNDEIGEFNEYPVLYIGVTKRRKHTVGLGDVRWVTSLEFHEVTGGDDEYLFVDSNGIKSSDTFQFYCSDANTALSTCLNVSETLKREKLEWGNSSMNKKEAFGGFVFACSGRGDSFFGGLNQYQNPRIDSSPMVENFPEIPLCGIYCGGGEIARSTSESYIKPGDETTSEHLRTCLHAFSSAYLVMTYNVQPFEE